MMDLCASGNGKTILRIPYETTDDRGKFVDLGISAKNLTRAFIPQEPPPLPDLIAEVKKAVENPIGGKKLSELLNGARKVAIITENQFRGAPVTEIPPFCRSRSGSPAWRRLSSPRRATAAEYP